MIFYSFNYRNGNPKTLQITICGHILKFNEIYERVLYKIWSNKEYKIIYGPNRGYDWFSSNMSTVYFHYFLTVQYDSVSLTIIRLNVEQFAISDLNHFNWKMLKIIDRLNSGISLWISNFRNLPLIWVSGDSNLVQNWWWHKNDSYKSHFG